MMSLLIAYIVVAVSYVIPLIVSILDEKTSLLRRKYIFKSKMWYPYRGKSLLYVLARTPFVVFSSIGVLSFLYIVIIFFYSSQGYSINIVGNTGSMEPSLKFGCIVVEKNYVSSDGLLSFGDDTLKNSMTFWLATQELQLSKMSEIEIGDIVTYRYWAPYSVTHRVINVSMEGVQVKGDANYAPDFPVDVWIPWWAVETKTVDAFC